MTPNDLFSFPTKQHLVDFIDNEPGPHQVRAIARHFGIPTSKEPNSRYSKLRSLLQHCVFVGDIAMTQSRPKANRKYHSTPRLVQSVPGPASLMPTGWEQAIKEKLEVLRVAHADEKRQEAEAAERAKMIGAQIKVILQLSESIGHE